MIKDKNRKEPPRKCLTRVQHLVQEVQCFGQRLQRGPGLWTHANSTANNIPYASTALWGYATFLVDKPLLPEPIAFLPEENWTIWQSTWSAGTPSQHLEERGPVSFWEEVPHEDCLLSASQGLLQKRHANSACIPINHHDSCVCVPTSSAETSPCPSMTHRLNDIAWATHTHTHTSTLVFS